MTMVRRGRWAAFAFVLKLTITVGLLALLLRRFDLAPVLRQLRVMSLSAAASGEALLLVQLGLLAWRWHLINVIVDAPLRAGQLLRLSAVGHFFNQVLPSGFAGDGARAWIAGREGARVGSLVRAILCDRITGLMVLGLMASATMLALPAIAVPPVDMKGTPWVVSLLSLGGLGAFYLLARPITALALKHPRTHMIGGFVDDLHRVLFGSGARSVFVLLLAVAVQLLNVAAILCCATGLHVVLGAAAAVVIVPTVMLVSVMPISVAGWGVRESAMVVGLGFAGIGAADALAVSVAFGLMQAVLGIPGGLLWLFGRKSMDGSADTITAR